MNGPLQAIIAGKWPQLAAIARGVWDDLSLDEVIRCEGDARKLASLVKQRYEMTQEEADKQVMSFFERQRTT